MDTVFYTDVRELIIFIDLQNTLKNFHWAYNEMLFQISLIISSSTIILTKNTIQKFFFVLFQEIASMLIAFERHNEWLSKEVKIR